MAATVTSIRLGKEQADKASEALAGKTSTEPEQQALEEAAALKRFKNLMLKYGGKCSFDGCDE